MRRFVLERSQDVSGVSGTGQVVEGIQFSDGVVAIRWMVELTSTAIYNSIDELVAIHGHDGATQLVWVDDNPLEGVVKSMTVTNPDGVTRIIAPSEWSHGYVAHPGEGICMGGPGIPDE